MKITIKIAAANQPEYFVRIVRTESGMASDANHCFEQLVVVGSILAETERCESITKMHIGLWEIDVAHFFQKVT
ncbi:MAG: hypothetical protein ACTSWW_06705 [Promethearchaeota archaeon]